MGYALGNGIALIRFAVLVFAAVCIASCGGGGGGGGAAGRAAGNLFVADSGNAAIVSIADLNPAPGTSPVERVIRGTSSNGITPLGKIPALLLDASRDQLYVSNETSIFVFNRAGFAEGAIDYNRRVATLPGSGNFNSLQLDAARDMLYVGDLSTGVRVYHNASTASEPGAATNLPTRTISFTGVGTTVSVRDIALDAGRDILYVAVGTPNGGGGPLTMAILVFDAASGLNGTVPPTRTITIPTTVGGTMGLFVDAAHDRLYFASPDAGMGGGIFTFETASTRNDPSVVAERSFLLPSPALRLTVDTLNDRLYAAGSTALYIVANVSAQIGPTVPGATAILPSSTGNFTAVAVRQ